LSTCLVKEYLVLTFVVCLTFAIDDLTYNCLYLARILDNRVTVTKDPQLKEKLFSANNTLKAELNPVSRACDAVRRDASPANLDAKEQHVKVSGKKGFLP
jgi:hypothetical protein